MKKETKEKLDAWLEDNALWLSWLASSITGGVIGHLLMRNQALNSTNGYLAGHKDGVAVGKALGALEITGAAFNDLINGSKDKETE